MNSYRALKFHSRAEARAFVLHLRDGRRVMHNLVEDVYYVTATEAEYDRFCRSQEFRTYQRGNFPYLDLEVRG